MSLKMSETRQVSSSIVYRLNTWHLLQLFFGFLWINVILILLTTALLWLRAETYVFDVAETMTEQELIMEADPEGVSLPSFCNFLLPSRLENARRVIFSRQNVAFLQQVKGMTYRVWLVYPEDKNLFYAVDYSIGEQLLVFLPVMFAVICFELLFLLGSIGKGARSMRKALQPIADLTVTARNINQKQAVRPDKQLRDLTGTIDNITASQLDTRIPVAGVHDELKDLAAAINGMLDRINESYRSQVRFVSDASHELRTPIAVIQGYANLLDRWGKNDPHALQESIDAIKSEADNMKEMVEQLLFLARGDNDSLQLKMEEFDLSRLAAECVREMAMIDVSHEFKVKTEDEVYTIGDMQLIKQAIRILLDNSVKYTPAGGAIIVKTFSDGDDVKVVVQDEGIGIAPDDLPHVFDRFFRSDDSRARKTGGTGLGLSIAKWIIDRHNGKVEILSRQDIGTRITVTLMRSNRH